MHGISLITFEYDKQLRFVDLFAVYDGGDELGLTDLFNVVMKEVAVIHGHVGDLTELDGAQAMIRIKTIGSSTNGYRGPRAY